MKIKQFKSPASHRLILAAAAGLLLTGAHARTWTSADCARTFDGELRSHDPAKGSVTVTLPNGKAMTFTEDKLSEADIAYLKEHGAKATASSSSAGGVGQLPDVLPAPDGKEADMTKPVQVYILLGQSNMLGFGKPDVLKGIAAEKYPCLVDDAGEWTVRNPAHFEQYEKNLIRHIKSLRKDFNAPDAKFVTASLGQTQEGSKGGDGVILDAMKAVSNSSDPELNGKVAFVYTHPLSKGGSSSGHYGGNPETYMNVGEAMGKAMVGLLQGK